MNKTIRFFTKCPHPAASPVYILQTRNSCTAAIAQDWLSQKGISATFKRNGWWYEASWPDSPEAQAIAPALYARANRV